ncbi:PQQ-binding-like beta-propeller repeat protein [Draconibacterium sp. IB214405]|uniref:outer membrane protein assembly factor BamB family protein n=1 Tax=Draconibacterium sp. IB214405 TaxID=3097352 RepID=UPI002A144F61|nr:PQQ-binding-like beta-propeller repeat protein [Draconibacterium sp. IB214405]MDX8338958.1 PQQ-binding-like beta-propeller repeat protein [Draconibacterium sp. IB214405]
MSPLFVFLFILSACSTNEWPQLYGPNSNMVIQTANLPTEWNDSLNVRWSVDMEGESWSSPIVFGDKIFMTSSVLIKEADKPEPKEETEPQEGQPAPEDNSYTTAVYRWQLTCLDAKSGKELWKQVSFEGNPRIKKHVGSTYACETPVTDGKYVYAYYGMVGVYCYDMSGNLIWTKDLGAYPTLNGWGTGASPVVYGGMLYVLVDNEESSFLVALDAASGEEKWKVNREETTNYSSPVIWKNVIGTELVVMGKTVRSYNPETGDLNWQINAGGNFAIPSPVFDDEFIYFGNAGGPQQTTSLMAVKAGAKGDISLAEGETSNEWVAWSNANTGISNPSPVLYNGMIYVLSSRGGDISCVNASTGEVLYQQKVDKVGACWASPWINNDKLYFYDERGITRVIKTGSEFEVLGENKLDDKFWASVVPTSDAYVFKGVEKIYCVGL